MKPIMEFTNIEKRLDSLHIGPINLSVEPGTITTIVGTNGAGKSTLLKLMMHLVKPDQGNIKLLNSFVHGPDENWKKNISYQPQTAVGWNAFTGKSLRDFIAPLYPNWDEVLFKRIVEAFNIPLNKSFVALSQGIQQKLKLALTLPRNTSLLLLDEPTAYMDIPAKEQLMNFIVEWMEHGHRAIVMASHQSADIMKLSDYLVVLKQGKLIDIFEKETLIDTHKQYWFNEALPVEKVPGELFRKATQLISNNPERTEAYLHQHGIAWTALESLNLEEIITLILTK
ncbi:hypothetical protein M948_06985 [Virgibacillus sp. CM-4]|uniref:ATP-binding cassette domain-containing protein n=1 Tax=Virgibacillus sp. CM-4 TaxID=1354277 RepID=UPI0003884EAF|nr:ABC transporter ATP-binding protein [Virgibacillus sp. CM-4]EQB38318.1 hypothetical protein M948_06985 [Virgibacillus sp. CM-4]